MRPGAWLARGACWGLVALAVWLAWNTATMAPATRDLWRVMWAQARRGFIGVGIPGQNGFDFAAAGLEPGDIVLGGNPGTSWGEWTHGALYVGNGLVIDTLLRRGVHLAPVDRFAGAYARAGYLKVHLPPAVKERAVREGLALLGRPFNLLAPRRSGAWFYCTKVAWYAYWRAGVDLDPGGGYWVVPDRFLASPHVELVASGPPSLAAGAAAPGTGAAPPPAGGAPTLGSGGPTPVGGPAPGGGRP